MFLLLLHRYGGFEFGKVNEAAIGNWTQLDVFIEGLASFMTQVGNFSEEFWQNLTLTLEELSVRDYTTVCRAVTHRIIFSLEC